MNANITKMQIYDDMNFDPIIKLTYFLMDNFCPCFEKTNVIKIFFV